MWDVYSTKIYFTSDTDGELTPFISFTVTRVEEFYNKSNHKCKAPKITNFKLHIGNIVDTETLAEEHEQTQQQIAQIQQQQPLAVKSLAEIQGEFKFQQVTKMEDALKPDTIYTVTALKKIKHRNTDRYLFRVHEHDKVISSSHFFEAEIANNPSLLTRPFTMRVDQLRTTPNKNKSLRVSLA
ncbi:hypothetical protein ACJMK2_038243 [Sinanodonta woodiana]|uniref:Uncharacterized protein n=1 Tax=Sinanodonta woodiana TaxID=1069815 RepID=A0ABD3W9V6_SINWO